MPNIILNIHHIELDQFATINLPEGSDTSFRISVCPGCNVTQGTIAVSVDVRFEENAQTFMLMKATSFFTLGMDSWNGLKDADTGNITIPEQILSTAIQISISQTRGILYTKTLFTPFSRFVFPLVDVSQIEGLGDMVILPDGTIMEPLQSY